MTSKLSSFGRTYRPGVALDLDLRRCIIDEIVANGGDILTGYFPGTYEYVARKYRVARSTVRKVWEKYYTERNDLPDHHAGGNPGKLTADDLELIEILKNRQGSTTLKEIFEILEDIGDCGGETSISAISRAIKERMPSGQKYTRKKITHLAKERFTQLNMIYTQLFINYLSSKNPFQLKFFDEAGVKTPDVGTRRYGHSPRGSRCIEVIRKCESPNLTLNVLTSLYDGVGYYNIIDGATNTLEFLNFFTEASEAVSMVTGRPTLEGGDIVVMDNLSCHHYEGGEILEEFFEEIGVELLYTPVYSPDLNPAEFVFSKVKNELNYDLQPVVQYDLKMAVSEAIDTITPSNVVGFYRNTSYIFV